MYYYGYGAYNNPCYQPYGTPMMSPCSMGVPYGMQGGFGQGGWLAIVLVIFILLVICGFFTNNNGRGNCGGCNNF